MKKLIMVSCILFTCCFWVQAGVKEVEKFSKKVDELSLSLDTFLEYAPKISKTFGTVRNLKINSSNPRKSVDYDGMEIKTKEDFDKLYNFLRKLEENGDLTLVESVKLVSIQIQIESAIKRLSSDFIYLFDTANELKKKYPNDSKRKIVSDKLKKIYKVLKSWRGNNPA